MPSLAPGQNFLLPPKPSIADVVASYLAHTAAQQGARTYAERRRVLQEFSSGHGTLAVADAKPYHLRLWVDAHDNWHSDWTKKGAIQTVQRAFNWAAKLGVIGANPFAGVSQPEGEPGRAATDAEFRAMLRASSTPFRRILIYLRFTGCRPCEASALEPEHFDERSGVVVLRKHKTAKTRKDRKPRVVVLHPVAIKLLKYLQRNMVPEQRTLFINSRGTPWTRYSLSNRLKRLRTSLGLPADCRLYGLRHKFGTDAITRGVDIKTLSVLMGHTSARTTERYVHLDGQLPYLGEAVRRAVSRLS